MSDLIDLERRDDGVAVVRMVDGENRFNRRSIDRWHEVSTSSMSVDGPLAVVVTGEGKFFSNGLDLDWFSRASRAWRAVWSTTCTACSVAC